MCFMDPVTFSAPFEPQFLFYSFNDDPGRMSLVNIYMHCDTQLSEMGTEVEVVCRMRGSACQLFSSYSSPFCALPVI